MDLQAARETLTHEWQVQINNTCDAHRRGDEWAIRYHDGMIDGIRYAIGVLEGAELDGERQLRIVSYAPSPVDPAYDVVSEYPLNPSADLEMACRIAARLQLDSPRWDVTVVEVVL